MFGFGERQDAGIRVGVLWGVGIALGALAAGAVARAVVLRLRERQREAAGMRARLRAAIDRLWPRGTGGRGEVARAGRRVRGAAGVMPRRA